MSQEQAAPVGPGRGPLNGVRVLELGNFIAAPTAGRLMAELGADVIKIERPLTGDELGAWRRGDGDTSLLFRTIARGKRSVTPDLRKPEGRDLALGLAAQCDVVLENFRPGTLERLGLGPAELTGARPDIILVRVSGHGQTGPYRDRPGFASVADALGGLRNLTGDPDRPPVRVGVSLGDSLAGLYAAFGAVMALLRRDRARQRGEDAVAETVDVAHTCVQCAHQSSSVQDKPGVGHAVEPQGALHHLLCVRHGRHQRGVRERDRLDAPRARSDQPFQQLDRGICGKDDGFVLQPVPGADLNDGHVCHGAHGVLASHYVRPSYASVPIVDPEKKTR